jgi:hypothetical protein
MDKTDKAIVAQHVLAALAVIGAVAQNIWGMPSPTLETLFTTIITATVWGGYQRKRGRTDQENPKP